jgi:hypothetical protein
MKKSLSHLMLAAIVFSITVMKSNAQPGGSRPSPKMTATGKIGDADITVTYGSPAVKGRKIWGGLVPYDTMWRAGANEATLLETSKDIVLQGKKLPAGKYSLYTIPGEKNWRIVINGQTGQWGIKRTGETTRDRRRMLLSKPLCRGNHWHFKNG